AARKMLTKVVNALTAMREIGGPAASSYLLGLPDHYTNHRFKVFFWYNYVQHITQQLELSAATDSTEEERVLVAVQSNTVVAMNKVNDYIYRPVFFEKWSLYDYLRATDVKKADHSNDELEPDPAPKGVAYRFLRGHPLHRTHVVRLVPEKERYVLNFVGGTLPRVDRGDLVTYHKTMMIFFSPTGWRSARDLLPCNSTWADVFTSSVFSDEATGVMKNMNVLYECLDARDDYSAARRAGQGDDDGAELGRFGRQSKDASELVEEGGSSAYVDTERDLLALLDDPSCVADRVTVRKTKEMDAMRDLLARVSYSVVNPGSKQSCLPVWTLPSRDPAIWKDCVTRGKQAVIASRSLKPTTLENESVVPVDRIHQPQRTNIVAVVTADSLRKLCPGFVDTPLQDSAIITLVDTLEHFTLNTEQQLAFTIVAHTIQQRIPDKLRMFLSGMAGTGKSEVLKALMYFMGARGESHRLLVLAPTGSSASNVNGSTYHSALCFGRDHEDLSKMDDNKLARLR
ncbi:uncharacterized protein TRAVEDRAFT_81705, partial [Trametes versicolor FP-101664 SS1]|uniref:uncharacterized protein n=1 Tax=Trametes versicolor (strain FP-101664) TaxID=717944 RepID=UPI00046230B1